QLGVLVAGYLLVGLAGAVMYLHQGIGLPPIVSATHADVLPAFWGFLPIAFLVVALLFVIARSEVAEARESELELGRLLIEGQRSAAAARAEHEAMRERLARVLHNHVQGDLVALALRLRLGAAGPEDVAALLERVDRMLDEAVA